MQADGKAFSLRSGGSGANFGATSQNALDLKIIAETQSYIQTLDVIVIYGVQSISGSLQISLRRFYSPIFLTTFLD